MHAWVLPQSVSGGGCYGTQGAMRGWGRCPRASPQPSRVQTEAPVDGGRCYLVAVTSVN